MGAPRRDTRLHKADDTVLEEYSHDHAVDYMGVGARG